MTWCVSVTYFRETGLYTHTITHTHTHTHSSAWLSISIQEHKRHCFWSAMVVIGSLITPRLHIGQIFSTGSGWANLPQVIISVEDKKSPVKFLCLRYILPLLLHLASVSIFEYTQVQCCFIVFSRPFLLFTAPVGHGATANPACSFQARSDEVYPAQTSSFF